MMKLGLFLILAFGSKVKCYYGFDNMTMTPYPTIEPTAEPTPYPTLEPTPCPTLEPTPCPTPEPIPEPTPYPTPTITPTDPSNGSSCVIPLPTTTLSCKGYHESCKQCKDNQTCVQVGKIDDGSYECPTFECKDCPEPVCDPPCGCKEECVILSEGKLSCPIAKCQAIPVCLTCPQVSCDSLQCEENFECKLKSGSCDVCPTVSCEPKPCLECATSPITCMCPRGKECKVEQGSCYKCPVINCVDVSDPCADCKGECSVSPNPNCENCPPKRLCVNDCRECSPFLPNWKCPNAINAIYISRTCTTCSEYRCENECRNCSKNQAKCDCENPDDCILQPRSCDQCPTFYCKKECVKDGPGEECKCEDSGLCVYREGNCFTRSYYECVPPGKSLKESEDLIKGRQEAKKRNYK